MLNKINTSFNHSIKPTDLQDVKLMKACKEFESVLVSQMFKEMRKTVSHTDLFGSGEEEQLFQEMMDQEMSKSISNSSDLGLASVLYSQLSPDKNIIKVSEKTVEK